MIDLKNPPVSASKLLTISSSPTTPPTGLGLIYNKSGLPYFKAPDGYERALTSRAVYDVKDYGAVGDGVTDDTAAIQAAIDACEAALGGTVFFPRSSYKITSALTVEVSGVTLQGAGNYASVIQQATNGQHTFTIGTGTQKFGIHVRDLWIQPSVAKTSGAAFYVNNITLSSFSNLYIVGEFKGFDFAHASNNEITLDSVTVTATTASTGVSLDCTAQISTLALHNCTFAAGGTAPLAHIRLQAASGVFMQRVNASGAKYDLHIAPSATNIGENIFISDCWFDFAVGASSRACLIDATNGRVSTIKFSNTWFGSTDSAGAGGGAGVQITGGGGNTCGDIIFAHCIWIANKGTQLDIDYQTNGRIGVYDSTFTGNTTGGDIDIAANVSNWSVEGCYFGPLATHSVSSGTGLNIAAGTGDYYTIIGNDFRNTTGLSNGATGVNMRTRANIGTTGVTIAESSASGGTWTLTSTHHATKGSIYLGSSTGLAFDEANGRMSLNVATSSAARFRLSHNSGTDDATLHVLGTHAGTNTNVFRIRTSGTFSGASASNYQGIASGDTFAPAHALTAAFQGNFSPSFAPSSGGSIGTAIGLRVVVVTGNDAGTISGMYGGYFGTSYGSQKPTTVYGNFIDNVGSASITTAYGLYINTQSGAGSNYSLVVAGGNSGFGTTAPTQTISLGGNSAQTIWMERHTTANTAGNNLSLQAGGATSGATDKAGGSLYLKTGVGTGTGTPALIYLQTPKTNVATGTTDQTLITRLVFEKELSLSNNTTTAFISYTMADGEYASGTAFVTVESTNATDFCASTQGIHFSFVKKSGTIVNANTNVGNAAHAISGGLAAPTLTLSTNTSGQVTVNLNVTSFTPSSIKLRYYVINHANVEPTLA